MISRTAFCSAEAERMLVARTDTIDFAKAVRCGLDDIEDLLAEGAYELFGIDRADAPNHPG